MSVKNKFGQYFTVGPIADFMTGLVRHGCGSRVLEPSCGEGVFLGALKRRGFSNVTAYEIDGALAREWRGVRYESFVSSPLDERFDVVIGNPPYIRWKNLEPELKAELEGSALWNRYFNSLCDYLFIFILKSIEQLVEGGELVFICTEYWLNTTHSRPLRDYMCAHGGFSDIYHFKEAPLFRGVTASFIVFRYVKGASARGGEIVLHRFTGRGVPSCAEMECGSCFVSERIPQFAAGRRWILANGRVQEGMELFERKCSSASSDVFGLRAIRRIGDVCEIGNGMVSGLDAAFNVSDMCEMNDRERGATISVLKAKDLERFTSRSVSRYFFLPEDLGGCDFERDFPHFYDWLRPRVEALNRRYAYGRKIPYWSFVFPRNKKLFETRSEKIFIPCKERISHKRYFRFCLAPSGCYPLQDVTGIVRKDVCRESIEYLLYFLNSGYVFDWLTHNGIVKGEIVEFSEAPIASIPYRAIDWSDADEVAIHDEITWRVRCCLSEKDMSNLSAVEPLFNRLFA